MSAVATPPVDLSGAAALLADLRARGLRVDPLPDGDLYVRPADRLDSETIARIRAQKSALLDLLRSPRTWPCERCGRYHYPAPTVCYWCRQAEERPGHA